MPTLHQPRLKPEFPIQPVLCGSLHRLTQAPAQLMSFVINYFSRFSTREQPASTRYGGVAFFYHIISVKLEIYRATCNNLYFLLPTRILRYCDTSFRRIQNGYRKGFHSRLSYKILYRGGNGSGTISLRHSRFHDG